MTAPVTGPAKLPRWADRETSWVAVVLVAAAWSAVMAGAVHEPLDTQRTLTFAGGPLLLLAGIHARTSDYLHAPQRDRLLPLPLPARRHWDAGFRHQLVGLGGTWVAGTLALASLLVATPNPPDDNLFNVLKLVADWTWLCLIALGIEPFFAGLSAYLGRRFPESHAGRQMQHSAGGGWTQDEAVVHLYAPAIAIGTAAALAMPGQLVLMAWEDDGVLTPLGLAVAVAPLLLALPLPVLGRRLYEDGVWEAVPWLTQATKTLAGPAMPEPTPPWLAVFRDPVRRVLVLQVLRGTPLPLMRLCGPLLWAAAVVVWRIPPSASAIAAGFGLVALWIMPLRTIARARLARARTFVALPLSPAQRDGRDLVAPVLAAAPVAVAVTVAGVAWSLM